MSKKVYTPPVEDCPECEELINTKCVVEEEALPGVGLSSGKTLSTILKRFCIFVLLYEKDCSI